MTTRGAHAKSKARKLRDLIERPGPFLLPMVYDALTAKYAERAGFEAVFMSGSGVAAALGFPDIGLVSLAEAAAQARYMANGVDLPLLCDCDTGYGNSLMAARTVQEFEQVGAAGIMIEDQVPLLRAPWVGGVTCITRDEFVGKIKAATDARRDPEFVIVARIDCFEQFGYEEVVARANACAAVGADLVFIGGGLGGISVNDAPKDIKVPLFTGSNLRDAAAGGYKVVLVGAVQSHFRSAMNAYFAELLKSGGIVDTVRFPSEPWPEFERFMGANEMLARAVGDYHERAEPPAPASGG